MCSIDAYTVPYILFTNVFCSAMVELQKSTINRLHIAYHNIFLLFLGLSKYESTIFLCTLFDVQCSQSVIRNLVYRFICRLDSSTNYIIRDILVTSLRFSTRICKHLYKLLYM